jgi:hypothetical protein
MKWSASRRFPSVVSSLVRHNSSRKCLPNIKGNTLAQHRIGEAGARDGGRQFHLELRAWRSREQERVIADGRRLNRCTTARQHHPRVARRPASAGTLHTPVCSWENVLTCHRSSNSWLMWLLPLPPPFAGWPRASLATACLEIERMTSYFKSKKSQHFPILQSIWLPFSIPVI